MSILLLLLLLLSSTRSFVRNVSSYGRYCLLDRETFLFIRHHVPNVETQYTIHHGLSSICVCKECLFHANIRYPLRTGLYIKHQSYMTVLRVHVQHSTAQLSTVQYITRLLLCMTTSSPTSPPSNIISAEILRKIQLTGSIPNEIGLLASLGYLFLVRNFILI